MNENEIKAKDQTNIWSFVIFEGTYGKFKVVHH